eukprot:TRINITY_DN3228_c0_g1_i1.p3 TRINITY_DN3228_c0_g1~~TRINITY_DN3228_c0_g1_i1.p3  ORF type:complete len:246 (+),score=-6.51 TRINITY_DN3228_c0_g1_i1:243-980(+)
MQRVIKLVVDFIYNVMSFAYIFTNAYKQNITYAYIHACDITPCNSRVFVLFYFVSCLGSQFLVRWMEILFCNSQTLLVLFICILCLFVSKNNKVLVYSQQSSASFFSVTYAVHVTIQIVFQVRMDGLVFVIKTSREVSYMYCGTVNFIGYEIKQNVLLGTSVLILKSGFLENLNYQNMVFRHLKVPKTFVQKFSNCIHQQLIEIWLLAYKNVCSNRLLILIPQKTAIFVKFWLFVAIRLIILGIY